MVLFHFFSCRLDMRRVKSTSVNYYTWHNSWPYPGIERWSSGFSFNCARYIQTHTPVTVLLNSMVKLHNVSKTSNLSSSSWISRLERWLQDLTCGTLQVRTPAYFVYQYTCILCIPCIPDTLYQYRIPYTVYEFAILLCRVVLHMAIIVTWRRLEYKK